ncbi:gamma-glutamyltransferase family protein [Zwartia vadi]|uniref:gamma-glutamyltransferase family protein n=1 Tax=Zwartia vadi TaxID=3058168 RepID=UPI0025B34D77|nr:gamma-glutamyltransferase [Zwartia vadi]MDN3987821.1 gamma-glutamyltransferase [Zwartia vadi]
MLENFSSSQTTRKTVVSTKAGVVAAQHRRAAEVGAAVLNAGGDAVDAAIATSFAIGVVEPWMSGPAAGGTMVLWRAKEGKAHVIDFGCRSPRELNPADYPLSGAGKSSDLFPWPSVVEDRNVMGATAVAVPGAVAGMDLAHKHFGRMPWKDLVTPAAKLAEAGLLVDWYTTLVTAANARVLSKDPDTAKMFLDEGHWPIAGEWTSLAEKHLNQKAFAQTLMQIAEGGANAFYKGDIAEQLAKDVRAKGGCLSVKDLHDYQASMVEPLTINYRGGRVYATPGLTGGPTFGKALEILARELQPTQGKPGAATYAGFARALDAAFKLRLENMGDHESPKAPGSTTHFSVVDREGNMCAVTQTLLSIFGSRVVSPSTGMLLNNGIMWFDPEPGKPNSLAPNKRCLANYSPVIGEDSQGRRFAIGASGGRKILGAVMQLSSFMIDHGLSLEEAFHTPRIDVSGGGKITADQTLPADVIAALEKEMPVIQTRRNIYPYSFACPAGVMRDGEMNMGCTEIMSPYGDAISGG